jgi:putative MATE family efflux protein
LADQKREQILNGNLGSLLWRYSLPSMVGMLFIVLNGIMDSIFVGNAVGPLGLSALGIIIPYIEVVVSFSLCIGVGASSIIARALGDSKTDVAGKTFNNGLVLVLVCAGLISWLGFQFTRPILALLGTGPETYPLVSEYFFWINAGFIFYLLAVYANNILRAQGFASKSMLAMIIGILSHIGFNYFFIFILHWGIRGAALATNIGAVINLTITFCFLLSSDSKLRLRLRDLKPDWTLGREIFSVGYSSIVFSGSLNIVSIIINRILIFYGGPLYIAMVNIFERLMYFALIPRFGMAEGIIPLIGFNYGARNYPRVLKLMLKSILHATFLTTLAYVAYMLFPEFFIRVFSEDRSFTTRAAPFFQIAILLFPLIPTASICMTIFQALGKGHAASFLTFTRLLVLFLPFVIVLPKYYGVWGIFYAFPLADLLAFLLTGIFLYTEAAQLKRLARETA